MKKHIRLLSVFLIGAAAVVTAAETRKNFREYSIVPPPAPEWREIQDHDPIVVYGKETKTRAHTEALAVLAARVEPTWKDANGYLAFVKEGKRADNDPKRFKVLKESYTLTTSPAPLCVRYETLVEDHKPADADGAKFLLFATHGIGCMNPSAPDHYYDVQYSERGKPGEVDPALSAAGDAFISGFAFNPPAKK